jgi:general secretion pathway protein K
VTVTVEDERGKLDVNQVPPALLQALFSTLGADRSTAQAVANAISDWRTEEAGDRDDDVSSPYIGDGKIWGPPGQEIQRLDELQMVHGMTPALYRASLPYLTVALEQGPWLSFASPTIVAALAKAKRDSNVSVDNADQRGPVVLRIQAKATGANHTAVTRNVWMRLDGTLSGPAWHYRILAWEAG